MKFLKILFLFFGLMAVVSCGSEDDICLGGEATPRMKIKFKTKSTGKTRTLDSVFVKVDYGNGPVQVISRVAKTDSIFVPLRVDDATFTKVYVGLARNAITSEIQVNYITKSSYVSPACGVKKIYENVQNSLLVPNPVVEIEQNQNQITDESKTHLFLLF